MVFNKSSTDEELMRAYQDGDDTAFRLLFERHSSRVYGFLMAHLKNRAQADDVFQATFLKLHQARRHYDPAFPFPSWLFTVCKSVLIDHARKGARSREDSNEEMVAQAKDEKIGEAETGVALDGLPPNQRTAVELRYHDELGFEEIAKRLETTPANARKLVSRGVEKLRVLLGGRGGKP